MPGRRGLRRIAPVAQPGALSLPRRQRRPRPLRDQPPLLLRQCSVEVQHEGICISSQFGNDERHTLGHQARYEGHVAGKPVELGHDDRALLLPPRGQRCGQLRPSVEGIAPLPRFDLDEFGDQLEAFGRGEPDDGLPLGLDAEPGSALPGGGDPVVGNGLLHRDKLAGLLYKTHTTVCVLYVAKSLALFGNFFPNGW